MGENRLKLIKQSTLDIPPQQLWSCLKSTRVFNRVTSPLMTFRSRDGHELPPEWSEGQAYTLSMRLAGIVPLGPHTITFVRIDDRAGQLSTDESGLLIKSWLHTMTIGDLAGGRSVFRDELTVRNGIWTWPTCAGAYFFFAYRHWKLKRLIRQDKL